MHYCTIERERTGHCIDRAYSYRFDTPNSPIVSTGDTGPSTAVEQFAMGADILVSEIIGRYHIRNLNKDGLQQASINSH